MLWQPMSEFKEHMELRTPSNVNQAFKQELETIEHVQHVLSQEHLPPEQLKAEYEELGRRYEALLKQASKIMRIGDVAQRRLMNVQKELESRNDLLDQQAKAIERTNNELQQKNNQLSESLNQIGLLNDILDGERNKAENLLLNILPQAIAYRLQSGEEVIADKFDNVTVLFADIVGFTKLSMQVSASAIVKILNDLFSRFDVLVAEHQVEKIKTIGDCYMLAAGIPVEEPAHAALAAAMALDMLKELEQYVQETGHDISMRIGIHSGPVVAGVIGIKKFVYDLWGDTVNTASRMESHGVKGKIHCSEVVYEQLHRTHTFEPRGEIEVKGKGMMKTYFLLGAKK